MNTFWSLSNEHEAFCFFFLTWKNKDLIEAFIGLIQDFIQNRDHYQLHLKSQNLRKDVYAGI